MKIGHYVDVNGYFIGDVLSDSSIDNTLTLIDTVCPEGFHHPKWDSVGKKWVEGKSDADLLQLAKQQKLVEFKQNEQDDIRNGFTTNAVASTPNIVFELSELTEQNIRGIANILALDPNKTNIQIKTVSHGLFTFQRNEMITVISDAFNHVGSTEYKRINLEGQILDPGVDSMEKLNAIVW